MRVYVSGPIKNNPNYIEQFTDAEEFLYRSGIEDVINPFTLGEVLALKLDRTPSYEEYMIEDIRWLLDCDAIYMLEGWEDSKGAQCEKHVAEMCGLKVMYQ